METLTLLTNNHQVANQMSLKLNVKGSEIFCRNFKIFMMDWSPWLGACLRFHARRMHDSACSVGRRLSRPLKKLCELQISAGSNSKKLRILSHDNLHKIWFLIDKKRFPDKNLLFYPEIIEKNPFTVLGSQISESTLNPCANASGWWWPRSRSGSLVLSLSPATS